MADSVPHVQAVKAEELPVEKPQAVGPEQPVVSQTPATAAAQESTNSGSDGPTVPSKDNTAILGAPIEPIETHPSTKDFAAVPEVLTKTPQQKLFAELTTIITKADHGEMWGVQLSKDEGDVPTSIVLEKFLRANGQDVEKAAKQLEEALAWRKKMKPAELLEVAFDKSKFGGLGYVTTYNTEQGKEIVTWNIYGAVKDKKATFGNIEDFIKWRCALMEISVKELDLASKTVPIPKDGVDQYRMIQVHDYLSVSFLRQDPAVKAATKETISTFSMAYPELMREKFFVNVPLIMGWMFTGIKLFLSPETVKKFHPLSYGGNLAGELPTFGAQLPAAYGGKGGVLEEGAATTIYQDVVPDDKPVVATA